MMEYIYIGKIVNTHGIKGELRLLSDFEYKDKVFKNNFNIYIGNDKIKEVINTYRHHKIFDMITLKNYNNINEVLKYKGLEVYINSEDLILDNNEYLESDLIDLNVIMNNENKGIIKKIENYGKTSLLVVLYKNKEFLIPNNKEIIEKVDINNKQIIIKSIEGLIE